jgi:hypothetical protein
MHSANTYFVSRDRSLLGPLSINSAIVGSVLGGLIAITLCMMRVGAISGLIPRTPARTHLDPRWASVNSYSRT